MVGYFEDKKWRAWVPPVLMCVPVILKNYSLTRRYEFIGLSLHAQMFWTKVSIVFDILFVSIFVASAYFGVYARSRRGRA